MKRIILVAFMVIAGKFCFADNSNTVAGFVYETAVSSANTIITSVSTSAPTQVDNPQMSNRAAIEVQNIDSSANLWCTVVSSNNPTTPALNNGRKIAAGGSWFPNLLATLSLVVYSTTTQSTSVNQTAAKIWCVSDGTSTTKAAVTQAF